MSATRIKRITSHVGFSRYLDTVENTDLEIPRQADIPSPYAYSPTHTVYRDEQDRFIFAVETAHKRYDIFLVPDGTPLHAREDFVIS